VVATSTGGERLTVEIALDRAEALTAQERTRLLDAVASQIVCALDALPLCDWSSARTKVTGLIAGGRRS
jgi:hypothetical protein